MAHSLTVTNISRAPQNVAIYQTYTNPGGGLPPVWLAQTIGNGVPYTYTWDIDWALGWGTTGQRRIEPGAEWTEVVSPVHMQPDGAFGPNSMTITYQDGQFVIGDVYEDGSLPIGDMSVRAPIEFEIDMGIALYMSESPVCIVPPIVPAGDYTFHTEPTYWLCIADQREGTLISSAQVSSLTQVVFSHGTTSSSYTLNEALEFVRTKNGPPHNLPLKKDGIIYDILKDDDADAAARCIATAYTTSEPMTTYLGITFEQFYSFIQLYVARIVPTGHSLAAKREVTGNIVGVCLARDFYNSSITSVEGEFAPITALLAENQKKYRDDNPWQGEKWITNFMVAVNSEFRDRGIGSSLVEFCNNRAQSRGYQGVVASATSEISQNLCWRQHYIDYDNIAYRDFVYDGKKVFEGIQETSGCIFFVKPFKQL